LSVIAKKLLQYSFTLQYDGFLLGGGLKIILHGQLSIFIKLIQL